MDFEKINKSSPVPAYYQVKKIIHKEIKNGHFKPGDKILSENKLSELFAVSRMTVRKAIDRLVEDGMLIRKQGKGTFVTKLNNDKLKRDLSELTSLTKDMERSHSNVKTEILENEVVSASEKIAQKLDIKSDDKIIKLVRLRKALSKPFFLETSFIPFNICPELAGEDLDDSLFLFLEENYDYNINDAIISLEAVIADEYFSEMLDIVKSIPLIKVEQITYLSNGTPFQYVEAFSRGDMYKYYVHRKRKNGL